MAYWDRRISGRRFFLWLDVAAASILIALVLLKLQLRGLAWWDYLVLILFAWIGLTALRQLRKETRTGRTGTVT